MDFGLLKLKTVREAMIDPKLIDPTSTARGWCRNLINHNVHRICAMFSWAIENELIPESKGSMVASLREVKPLAIGRSKARESEKVEPVADDIVEATIPHLPSVVATMVKIQRFTAARLGEIIRLRTMDIDRTGQIWFYNPPQHKTAHHGRIRSIAIGPRAQERLALGFCAPK